MSDTGVVKLAGVLLLAALGACTTQPPESSAQTGASGRHRPDRAKVRFAVNRTPLPSRPLQRAPTASTPTPAVLAAAPAAVPAAASDAPSQKNQPQTSQPDWTALFKAWESGCANSPEFDAFEKHFVFFDRQRGLQVGEVRLPGVLKAATGTPVSRYRADYTSYILPVTAGTYYGIPVKSIELYRGNENGIGGRQIVLKASEQEAKEILRNRKVSFSKAKTYQAVVSGTARETTVTCDYSDSGG